LVSHPDQYASTLSFLQEAALDDALWPAVSGRIDETCGMRGNALVMARGHSQVDAKIFFARVCHHGERFEDWEQTYFNDYYPLDERVPRITQLPDSRLVHINELYTEDERRTSATYNKSLPLAGYQNGLNVRLDGPEDSSIYWALADSTSRGGWGSLQIAMIESLLPHIRHFLRVRHALGGAQALSASLSGLLDDTRLGVIYLDRSGRIIETNDRAMGLLRRGRGLFEQDGFLCARVPADDTRLQGLVADALPTFVLQATGGSMTVLRWPSRSRQVVHVVPVGDRQKDFGIGRVAVLVLVVEPGSPEQLEAELVASALGLTETESQVAVALAMGKSVTEIANEKGQRVSTARFHVKRIHTKLGLSRQMDLIRLVLSLGDAPGARGSHPE
jgi:DNA-binding CsgD family transcriptional regulator